MWLNIEEVHQYWFMYEMEIAQDCERKMYVLRASVLGISLHFAAVVSAVGPVVTGVFLPYLLHLFNTTQTSISPHSSIVKIDLHVFVLERERGRVVCQLDRSSLCN